MNRWIGLSNNVNISRIKSLILKINNVSSRIVPNFTQTQTIMDSVSTEVPKCHERMSEGAYWNNI